MAQIYNEQILANALERALPNIQSRSIEGFQERELLEWVQGASKPEAEGNDLSAKWANLLSNRANSDDFKSANFLEYVRLLDRLDAEIAKFLSILCSSQSGIPNSSDLISHMHVKMMFLQDNKNIWHEDHGVIQSANMPEDDVEEFNREGIIPSQFTVTRTSKTPGLNIRQSATYNSSLLDRNTVGFLVRQGLVEKVEHRSGFPKNEGLPHLDFEIVYYRRTLFCSNFYEAVSCQSD